MVSIFRHRAILIAIPMIFSVWNLAAQNYSYTTGFENAAEEQGWIFASANQTNRWYFGSGEHCAGSKSLYISSTGGTSCVYSNTNSSVSYAYYDFTLYSTTPVTVCDISYDWKCAGEPNGDYLRVFLVPTTTVIVEGIYPTGYNNSNDFFSGPAPTGWIDASDGALYNKSSWERKSCTLYVTTGSWRLLFVWCNNNNTNWATPSACIDNVSIYQPSCPMPRTLSFVGTVSADTTIVAWYGNYNGVSQWDVSLVPRGQYPIQGQNTITVTDSTYTFTNLPEGESFDVYVRSDCGNEHSPWVGPLRFATNLYTMGTSGTSTLTACHAVIVDDGGMDSNYSDMCDVTLKLRSPDRDSLLRITGTCLVEFGLDELRIYDGDGTTWPLIFNSSTDIHGSDSFGPILSSGNTVTIQFRSNNSYNWDGFQIYAHCYGIPDCYRPAGLSASPLADSCTVTWSELGTSTSWCLEYDAQGFSPGSGLRDTVYDTSYVITGLLPNTSYDCYVWAICQNVGNSDTAFTSFTTHCTGITQSSLPYIENFDAATRPSCWSFYYIDNGILHNGTTFSNISSLSATNGSYCLYLYTEHSLQASVPATYAVMPMLQSSADGLDICFKMFNNYRYYSNISVVTMANPGDVSTYNVVCTLQNDYSNLWREYEVPLVNIPPDHRFVAFAAMDPSRHVMSYIDEVVLIPHQQCTRPQNIRMVMGYTPDHATFSWSPGDPGNILWDIALVPYGENPDSCRSIIHVYDSTYTFTNLSGGIAYDFYVRSNCGNNVSRWRGPYTFATNECRVPFRTDTTITTCNTVVTDNYGLYSPYPGYCDGILTIISPSSDSVFYINGCYCTEARSDYLTIYDGADTSAPVIGRYSGLGQITSLMTTGNAVTIRFQSDPGGNYDGFALNVNCATPPECYRPVRLTATPVDDLCTLTWHEIGISTVWNIEYGPQGFTPGNGTSVFALDTIYNLSGLSAGTAYDCYVWANCQNGENSDTAFVTFTTHPAPPVSRLPYRCNFDDPSEAAAWMLLDSSQTNRWYRGTAAYHPSSTDSYGLYISDNGGLDNQYNGYRPSYSYACRAIRLDTGDYVCQFDWRYYNQYNGAYFLRAAIVPNDMPITAGLNCGFSAGTLPAGAMAVDGGSALCHSRQWTTHYSAFTITTPGVYKLVFAWQNQDYGQSDTAAAVDNVWLYVNTCPSVNGLTTTAVTSQAATVQWTPSGNETSWEVRCEPTRQCSACNSIVTTVQSPSATISPLQSGITYACHVRPICHAGDTGVAATTTVLTLCDTTAVTAQGWHESFEDPELLPPCWDEEADGINWQHRTGNAHDGNQALILQSYYSESSRLITPMFDLGALPESKLVFWQKTDNSNKLLLTARTSDTGRWDTLALCTTGQNAWHREEIPLSNYTAVQLAFLGTCHGGEGVYLDDISIIAACDPPEGLLAQPASTEAILSWTGNGTFEVTYKKSSDAEWADTQNVNIPTAILSDLTPATVYQWQVRKLCAPPSASPWVSAMFTTMLNDGIAIAAAGSIMMTVHPNPAKAGTNIIASVSGVKGSATITLIDALGRTLHISELNASDSDAETAEKSSLLRFGYLAPTPGTYFIKVQTGQSTIIKKLIVI